MEKYHDLFTRMSEPAKNLRLRAFTAQMPPSNFLKALYQGAKDAAAAFPNAMQPTRQGRDAEEIAPNARLTGKNFLFSSGAPSTVIAIQQSQRGGNSGLFTGVK